MKQFINGYGNANLVTEKKVQKSANKFIKTITFDNVRAFSLHHEIANEIGVKTYFTRPYASQNKGSIENRNGVIRRYYPKKTDFIEV